MTEELLAKAKEAQSSEELLKLMQENGMEDLTIEEAESLYAQVHMTGELTDEEMENVTGGKVNVGGQKYKVVYAGKKCFTGKWEDHYYIPAHNPRQDYYGLRDAWYSFGGNDKCGSCEHLGFTKALTGYCELEHDS